MLASRKLASILWTILLGFLLSSCASTIPADLEKLVRVFNVQQTGGETLPRKVEGCDPLGVVVASAPTPEEANVTTLSDPRVLLETIRARAHNKGADTAFVSIATGIHDSPGQQALGSPIRDSTIERGYFEAKLSR